MQKDLIQYIKATLRRAWGRSKQRTAALHAAKIAYGTYKCAKCKEIFRRKDIQVDHIIAVGKFKDFNSYIEKLFCKSNKLQVLCIACHKIKSKEDNKK